MKAMKCMKTLPVRTGGGCVLCRKNCVFLLTRVTKILQKGLPARTGGGHVLEQRHAHGVESVHSVPVQFGSLAPNSPIPEFQIRPFWSSTLKRNPPDPAQNPQIIPEFRSLAMTTTFAIPGGRKRTQKYNYGLRTERF